MQKNENISVSQSLGSDPKVRVHAAAKLAWENAGRRGIIVGATGIGKTKIALDRIRQLDDLAPVYPPDILLLVPTEKARDDVWPAEAKKWDVGYNNVESLCYVSANKAIKQHYNLLILDEGHHITPESAKMFENITFDEILVLTATVPGNSTEADREKWKIFDHLQLSVVFEYPVEDAVQDGVVSDFMVHVIELQLDNKQKVYKAGNKTKSWYNTEKQEYEYMDRQMLKLRLELNKLQGDIAALELGMLPIPPLLKKQATTLQIRLNILIGKRARFIYNLPSKTKYAQEMLGKLIMDIRQLRILVFAGSIAQSGMLSGNVFHSESGDEWLKAFQLEQIRHLVVVNAADESHNFPHIDYVLIVQASSVSRRMIQRIGRAIRLWEGHKANIIILMVKDTVDEKWNESALKEIDPSRIKRYKG